jgi:predicted amidohydrolase
MSDTVHIAVLSFQTTKNIHDNVKTVDDHIALAKKQGAQWVFLPELWTHRSLDDKEFISTSREVSDSLPTVMSEMAKKYSITLFAGTWPEISDHPGKFFNTQYVFDEAGKCIAKYRKIHLFAIQDDEKQGYAETKRYVAGNTVTTLTYNDWDIGLSTCFDLRFSGLYDELSSKKPLDIITVPSGFLERTGKYHWHALLRARAIEHQCYVIASNKIGTHEDPRIDKFYGHSLVIDPWGTVISDSGQDTGVFMTQIEKKKIQEVRAKIPMREVKSCKKSVY